MDLTSDQLPENARTALQTASVIQLTDAAAPNVGFYQWLLARARAGTNVELMLGERRNTAGDILNAAYFQRFSQAGGRIFSISDPELLPLPAFILANDTLLIPPENATGFFRLEEQAGTAAKYKTLFERYKAAAALESSPAGALSEKNIRSYFTVSPAYVEINQRFELSWEVEGAQQVRIEPLIGAVPPAGSRVLSAERDTEFLLTAGNATETVSHIARISVNPAAQIEYLLTAPGPDARKETPLRAPADQPDRYGVVKGQALRLYWRTYNATQVQLDGQTVPANGNLLLLPEQFSAYTLRAIGAEHSAQKTILVDVFPRPEIEMLSLASHAPGVIAQPAELPFSFTAPPPTEPTLFFEASQTAASRAIHSAPEPPITSLRDFFWFCSGASRQMLEQCPPTEHAKYAGIGGAVFFTGLLAALSGGYALFTAFQNGPAALLFGLLWGALIFNLDRLIVSTLKKEGSAARQWRQALPRIALAALLSVVIAKPLELRIFEPEIMEILAARKSEKARSTEALFREKAAGTEQRIAALKIETDASYRAREALYQEYRCECDGTCGTGRTGRGTECARKEAKYRQADAEYQALKTENDRLIGGLRGEAAGLKKQEALALYKIANTHTEGFVARLSAAQELPFWPGFFIALLILMVEIAPVISKILAPRGPYDEAVQAAETRFAAGQTADLKEDETLAQQQSDLRVRLHQVAADQEVERRQAILRLVADAQLQLAKEELERWVEEQRGRK